MWWFAVVAMPSVSLIQLFSHVFHADAVRLTYKSHLSLHYFLSMFVHKNITALTGQDSGVFPTLSSIHPPLVAPLHAIWPVFIIHLRACSCMFSSTVHININRYQDIYSNIESIVVDHLPQNQYHTSTSGDYNKKNKKNSKCNSHTNNRT